jgi:hypothetical protein
MSWLCAQGKTPVIQATVKYENLIMVSGYYEQGSCSRMIVEGIVTIERFLEFLSSLVKDAQRKIFLVLDNLTVHHGTIVHGLGSGTQRRN